MILPDNINRTLQQFRQIRQKRQHKYTTKIQQMNDFMIARMKNFIKPESYKNDFILSRKFQSENIMRIKKRRDMFYNSRDQRKNKSIDSVPLLISTIRGQNYFSLTINVKDPIHSRKSVIRKNYTSQIQRKKKDISVQKPFNQILSISRAIQQHLSNKNNHHQFLIRKHKIQRKNWQVKNHKPIQKLMLSAKAFQQYRPWSRQKIQNQQQVQAYSFDQVQ